jgi:hypothetical protein
MASNSKDHDEGEQHSKDIPMPDCEDEPEFPDQNAEHPPVEGEDEADRSGYYHQFYRPPGRTNTVRKRHSEITRRDLTRLNRVALSLSH